MHKAAVFKAALHPCRRQRIGNCAGALREAGRPCAKLVCKGGSSRAEDSGSGMWAGSMQHRSTKETMQPCPALYLHAISLVERAACGTAAATRSGSSMPASRARGTKLKTEDTQVDETSLIISWAALRAPQQSVGRVRGDDDHLDRQA